MAHFLLSPRQLLLWIAAFAFALAVAGCSKTGTAPAPQNGTTPPGDEANVVLIQAKNAVHDKPASVPARLSLADALERSFDLPGASEELAKALQLGADPNKVVPRLALMLLDRNEFTKIVSDYKSYQLTDPTADATLRGCVAMALVGSGRETQAAAQLNDAADVPAVTLAKAQLLLANRKAPEALALVRPVADAPDVPWWFLRGASRISKEVGDAPRSVGLLKRAVDAAPWHRSALGEYGEALLGAGQPAEAAAVRDQIRKVAPKTFWSDYLDALLLAHAGRFDDSYAATLRVLHTAPTHAGANLLAATAELALGDAPATERRLQATFGRAPSSLSAIRVLARAKLQLSKLGEANDLIRRGLFAAPEDLGLLDVRADLELARGQRNEAAATLATLAAAHPDDPTIAMRLAAVRSGLGARDQAATLLERAAKSAGTNTDMRGRVVMTAIQIDDVPLARKLADAGVAAMPDDVRARMALAAVQSVQKDHAGAWATTLAAVDKHPADGSALAGLRLLAQGADEKKMLRARYDEAVKRNTRSAAVYLDYAAMQRVESSEPKPLTLLEHGVRAVPESVSLRQALVDEYLVAGNVQSAIATAQELAAMSDAPLSAQLLVVNTYEKLGDQSKALDALRKVAAASPERFDLRMKLAQMEAASGQWDAAIRLLRKGVTERPSDKAFYVALAELLLSKSPTEAISVARQMAKVEGLKGAATLLEGDILARTRHENEALVAYSAAVKAGMTPAANLRIVQTLDLLGRGPDAEHELAEALRKHPDSGVVLGFASERAMAAGRQASAEVLQRYARAIEARANEPDMYLQYARLLRREGSAAKAKPLAVLEMGAAARPESVELLAALINEYMREGSHDKALSTAQTGASRANAPVQAQALLASTFERLGRTDQAIDAWRKLSAAYPQRHEWRLKVVELNAAAGRKAEAVASLRALITSRPLDAAPYIMLAKLEAPTNASEALSIARQMTARPELKLPGMVLEGEVLDMTKQYSEALAQYGRAATAGAVPQALLAAVRVLDHQERARDAEAELATIIQQYPKDPRVLGFAAARAMSSGQAAKSVELLKRVVEQDPRNAAALNDLAWAQVQARQTQAAETAAKAAALMPDQPDVLDTLGVALRLANKPQEAIAALRAATNLAPTAIGPRLHLAEALVASRDLKGATDVVKGIAEDRLGSADKATFQGLKAAIKG